MRQARAMQIDVDGVVELSAHEINDVYGGANSRSYSGPTEIVAHGEADVCPNGLAPHPWTRPGC